ncbi:hypothetical protein SHJG_0908 [Streptomyces hygroscopicus subsp. jinggangensis 5008]|nr:hypothetical protein SHJG_0908 [Streptomyces hygroscopicus subsp. jinggangensis 5008]AGF60407.1 hypothetical protein SHJGH_0741 [Streptomyces hygroscopicus subsp. jinggangensis TL01]
MRRGAIDGFTILRYLDGVDDTGTTLRERLGPREPLPHRSAPDRRQAGWASDGSSYTWPTGTRTHD